MSSFSSTRSSLTENPLISNPNTWPARDFCFSRVVSEQDPSGLRSAGDPRLGFYDNGPPHFFSDVFRLFFAPCDLSLGNGYPGFFQEFFSPGIRKALPSYVPLTLSLVPHPYHGRAPMPGNAVIMRSPLVSPLLIISQCDRRPPGLNATTRSHRDDPHPACPQRSDFQERTPGRCPSPETQGPHFCFIQPRGELPFPGILSIESSLFHGLQHQGRGFSVAPARSLRPECTVCSRDGSFRPWPSPPPL